MSNKTKSSISINAHIVHKKSHPFAYMRSPFYLLFRKRTQHNIRITSKSICPADHRQYCLQRMVRSREHYLFALFGITWAKHTIGTTIPATHCAHHTKKSANNRRKKNIHAAKNLDDNTYTPIEKKKETN